MIEIGQLKKAEIVLKKSTRFYSNLGIIHFYLSRIYLKRNNIMQAIYEIKEAIKNDPGNYSFSGELTRLRYIKGDFDDTGIEPKPWTDKEDLIFEDNNKDVLLVVFGSNGREESKGVSFDFYRLLSENNSFNKLFLRDMNRDYYINGLKNSTKNLNETIELLKKLISYKKYSKVVAIGSSSGGFAAILFGHLLKFKKVLAFNPQTIISEPFNKNIIPYLFSKEISIRLGGLNKSDKLYQKCLNLRNFIPFNTQVEIHYSQFSRIDTQQAFFIKHRNCQLIKHSSGSHLLTPELKEKGLLKDLILNSLSI